jgi:hypothetical protein
MAEAETVVIALPREVKLRREDLRAPRFTPRELKMIQEHLGRSFTEVITDENGDDKYSVLAWLKLRRDGYAISWEEMDDVVIDFDVEAEPDPTSEQPSTTSPLSASSGE